MLCSVVTKARCKRLEYKKVQGETRDVVLTEQNTIRASLFVL